MKFKVLFVRKWTAVFLGLSVAMFFMCCFGFMSEFTAQNVFSEAGGKKVILIDPGHGGRDAGASANGSVEKDINLAVSKILKKYIEDGGDIAFMTRETDTNTADPNRPQNVTQKKSDMRMRKADIEKYKADIFISIHMNKFEQSKYRGAQVFYDADNEENRVLAESIQNSLKEVLKDDNKRVPKATGDSIFVLRNNKIPSVLIECGFLSNVDEAKLLNTPEYQKKVAEGIYLGLTRYINR
ncbi:MAG: N-acetylmuramoyl-L-alanine amidase CwlD [Clostridia bacterium]|nr:N-acetylmuramoyl-L-alanine amidase CwlD [Clostridia bacterium]